MKNIKVIIGVVILAAIGGVLYFSNSTNFQGALKKTDNRPDLVGRISTFGPTTIGQPTTISAEIQNIGNGNASGFTVIFYINNEPLIQRAVSSVRAGGVVSQNEQWTPQNRGVHSARVCADVYNLIREPNELNNCETLEFYVPEVPEESGGGM